jgi:hypothetical protein
MKRKPENGRDFLMTVACVDHPNLKPEGRHFLLTLALSASYKTGRNAFPGAIYLSKASARSWDRVNTYAKHCEDLGLIKRVRTGHKGKNTEWIFCLEHEAYLDSNPEYIGPQEGTDQSEAIGPHLEPNRSASLTSKVRISPVIGPQEGADPSKTINTSIHPSNEGGDGRLGVPGHERDIISSLKETIAELNKIYEATENKILRLRPLDKENLRALVKDRPREEIVAAFLEARNQCLWHGWKCPLIPFIEGYDSLVHAAKRKAARKPLTDDEIKLAGERAAALRDELFPDDIEPEPSPEDF